MRDFAAMIMPGMQKPHCTAPASPKAKVYTSFSHAERPSTVMMLLPSSLSVWGTQALVSLPSISTWQVPQAPSLQPSFTLVSCNSSRRYRSSFWFFSTLTVFPFTVNTAMMTPLPQW